MSFPIKPYLIRLYLAAFGFFVVNKFVVRPLTAEVHLPRWIEIVIFSSPNLVEAVIGMITVALILYLARRRSGGRWSRVSDAALYDATALLAGAYVLTQEFKLHNLGGRNVYDAWDAVASAVGVLAMWLLFRKYGAFRRDGMRMSGRGTVPILALLFVAAGSPSVGHAQVESDTDPVRVVKALVEAFNEHDPAAMAALVTDDVELLYQDESGVFSAASNTRDRLEADMREYFAARPAVQSRITALIEGPIYVSIREQIVGGASSIGVFEVRDGLIRRAWYYPADATGG